ncbi:hypothetical protein QKC54_gp0677 [Megavirus baoshan]|uniref:Uncharacterized protein n=1 Tax=Megavirus baoshan TaxID=2496520 RepID=A0A8K1W693_9VIRU|nr:hypothetical protein QKC54_gp0677 [Megavirus baoshan]UFX99804.1 hypothetical protein Mb0395 [Megavirus baoshan]
MILTGEKILSEIAFIYPVTKELLSLALTYFDLEKNKLNNLIQSKIKTQTPNNPNNQYLVQEIKSIKTEINEIKRELKLLKNN